MTTNSLNTPSTHWEEKIDPSESARFERFARDLHEFQLRNAGKGPVLRTLHAKGQLGLLGEFTVLPDLPDYARIAIFAQPGTYKAYVRFSNSAGKPGSDRKNDIRGLAVKLVNVPGRKIIPGLETASTQDLLLIREKPFPFKNADEFVRFAILSANPMTGVPKLIFKLGLIRTLKILFTVLIEIGKPMVSLATTRYHGTAPIQFGLYAAKFSFKPHAVDEPGAQAGQTPNYLSMELSERLKRGPVVYDFVVQFFVDETRTPIEDASVEWKEDVAPFLTLARLILPPQDPGSPGGLKLHDFIEKLSFDPWHALPEFRPLGNIMRARRKVYEVSAKGRQANPEPDGSEKFNQDN